MFHIQNSYLHSLALGFLSLMAYPLLWPFLKQDSSGENQEVVLSKQEGMCREMVNCQIKARGIQDPLVLKAMLEVKRHLFVPAHLLSQAYNDYPLPIGQGQTISQPYIVALMTELLELKGGERVLEIGTGSGYQTAVLSRIASQVYSVEIVPELAIRAEEKLKEFGYSNIRVKSGDGNIGWVEESPFDAIIVTAAPSEIPHCLIDQLKMGGILVVPVGSYIQFLYKIKKTEEGIVSEQIAPVRFVPMTGCSE